MSAELLSKLTAKGLVITGEGFGGEVVLSSSDVAGALARVRGIGYYILRLKYCGDDSVREQLFHALAEWALDKTDASGEEAYTVANAAIEDSLSGDVCPTCKGTGTHRYKDCRKCDATGKAAPSDYARARSLGLTQYEYKKRGSRLFRQVAGHLSECEGEGVDRMVRSLRGGRRAVA